VADTFRWGILGTGWIAETFVTDLNDVGIEVGAVGSRSQESADAFASRFGIATAYGSYEDLVADDSIDAIYVATPHPMHAENALLAIAAGKHVLVEKAFTLNSKEAARVAEAAATADVVVLEAMWTRFLPHMIRIREIIAAGTIGEVHTVIADHDQLLPKDPEHRINNPALGGGALLDLGIYPISFAVDILGLPSKVIASATKTETGVDRQVALILEHGADERSLLHMALDTAGPNRAAVIGTLGRIEIDPVWYTQSTFTAYDSTGAVIERFDDTGAARGMQFQAWELERVVAEGRDESELLPLSESVSIMAVLDEVRSQIGLIYPGE
jgi:predicted dehydrogenase